MSSLPMNIGTLAVDREVYIYDRYRGNIVLKSEYQPPDHGGSQDGSALFDKPVERGRWIWDREAGELLTVDAFYARRGARQDGPLIIRDIDPYQAVASDLGGSDKPIISGRRQHREFLSRNNYVEVGNDMPQRQRQEMPSLIHDLKRAMGE